MEINFGGREKNRNTYKKRRGRGGSVSERERDRDGIKCGGKIHRMIKMEREYPFSKHHLYYYKRAHQFSRNKSKDLSSYIM